MDGGDSRRIEEELCGICASTTRGCQLCRFDRIAIRTVQLAD
jgi:hypothetical protein